MIQEVASSVADSRPHTLVMLSGGLDSTAALLKLLAEGSHPVHVHFVLYKNDRHRWEAERMAVTRVMRYLTRKYRKVDAFTTSEQDYRGFGRAFYDIPMIGFTASMLCRVQTHITHVATGICTKEDLSDPSLDKRLETMKRVFAAGLFDTGRTVDLIFPVAGYAKSELLTLVGEELFDQTWSCRMPLYQRGVPIACCACKACHEVQAAVTRTWPGRPLRTPARTYIAPS